MGKSLDTDQDGLPDDWERHWFGNLDREADEDPDLDGLLNIVEYRYALDPLFKAGALVVNLTKKRSYHSIQGALSDSDHGDEIIVPPAVYRENIRFGGKNVILRAAKPSESVLTGNAIIDGSKAGPTVTFAGTESATCVLSGFVIRNGKASFGGGICGGTRDVRTRATIQNNLIVGNLVGYYDFGGGLAFCQGAIVNNTIVDNMAGWSGGGLYLCTGTIRNCIIWGNTARYTPQVDSSVVRSHCCTEGSPGPGEGNTSKDPRFVDEDGPDDDPKTHDDNDYRLLAGSPCIDAGFNHPDLPETDVAGMRRIMYGGKSLTVDMGAYESYVSGLAPGPAANEVTLTWSSLAEKTYSVFYAEDLLTWHLVVESFASAGNETTSWIDDGSLTGLAPLLGPCRFYRVLENP